MNDHRPLRRIVACLLAYGWLVTPSTGVTAQNVDPAVLACTPDRPSAETGAQLGIHAWADAANDAALEFEWRVSGGRVVGQGPDVTWNLKDVAPAHYTATVHVTGAAPQPIECTLDVIVAPRIETKGVDRLSAGAFLFRGHKEAIGYGLYTYVIIPFPPPEAQRARHVAVIRSFLAMLDSVMVLEAQYQVPRDQLNITYIPVARPPPANINEALENREFETVAGWVMANYDHARGQLLSRAIAGNSGGGPFVASAREPLTGKIKTQEVLFQDFSLYEPVLAYSKAGIFLNLVAQENLTDPSATRRVALQLRNVVRKLAKGNAAVQSGLDQLIQWRKQVGFVTE